MSFSEHATARLTGAVPDDLIPHFAEHVREADLTVDEMPDRLIVLLPGARVEIARDATGLAASIGADNAALLHQLRDYLLFLFDHIIPGSDKALVWTGRILRNTAPPNFHIATVRSVRRVAPRFLRVELDCPGTSTLAKGRGMHFTLLLPPPGRAPVWPRLDGNGRTVWPEGGDSLHRAAYTFVDLDAESGRFTFDIFEHEGGKTTGWAQTAPPGAILGLTGPGSGEFPPGDDILMAGDETALPAIRRILEHSAPDRRGEVFVEVADDTDICDLHRPEGIALTWVIRARGETLWDHLHAQPVPTGGSRFVWIAAEQDLVRKAKARFRGQLGVGPRDGYFAYYWTA